MGALSLNRDAAGRERKHPPPAPLPWFQAASFHSPPHRRFHSVLGSLLPGPTSKAPHLMPPIPAHSTDSLYSDRLSDTRMASQPPALSSPSVESLRHVTRTPATPTDPFLCSVLHLPKRRSGGGTLTGNLNVPLNPPSATPSVPACPPITGLSPFSVARGRL